MNSNIPYINQDQIFDYNKKTICFFGSGNIAKKTKNLFKDSKLDKIFDNSANLWNSKYLGKKIMSPKFLKKKDFIIITSSSYYEISKQLKSLKFKPYKDFIVSPILNSFKEIIKLENLKKNLIFSSGSPPNNDKLYGGGLYKLNIDGDNWKYEKIYSGNCFGIINVDNKIIFVDEMKGIVEMDQNFKIKNTFKLQKGIRPHGIAYHKEKKRYYLCSTELDQIKILNQKFIEIDKINLSKKKEHYGNKHHHLNDCEIVKKSLFVSMFSYSGNISNDVYDGSIVEYYLNEKKHEKVIKRDLWMPHNIKYIDNIGLCVLNSFKGELLYNNLNVEGKFSGFARGLAYDNKYFYVGLSRNRNFSKLKSTSLNTSIDTGIVIFEPNNKISRFIQLSPKLSEVHSIHLV